MTLLVFLGVVAGLLILRMVPSLLLRLILTMPRQRVIRTLRMVRTSPIRTMVPARAATLSGAAPAANRLRMVLVSSSLLALAALVTTALWKWHATGLMLLLR